MKILSLIIPFFALMFVGCNNYSTNTNDNDSDEVTYKPSQELIDYANQYHLNIDTTNTYNINIKVFQTLDDNDCLAHECSNDRLGFYNGQLVYYVTSDMVYDDKIIKEKAYLLGTYRYKTIDTIRPYRVVPFYCETNEYRNLKNDGFFDFIIEIQNH